MAARPEVVVTDPVDVDLHTFSLWLKGIDVHNATSIRLSREPPVTRLFTDYTDLLHSETEELYRLFNSIESYLQSPPVFMNQYVYQVRKETEPSMRLYMCYNTGPHGYTE